MNTATAAQPSVHVPRVTAWLPLAVLPVAATLLAGDLPGWGLLWALSFAIYCSLKWLTYADTQAAGQAPLGKSLGYLVLWAGMDAETFFTKPVKAPPVWKQWVQAAAKTLGGLVCLAVAIHFAVEGGHSLLIGWLALTGLAFVLHFGLIHLVSLAWRQYGVAARPIMNAPILARNLNEFWGQRWNLAFRDVAHTYIFTPLVNRVGLAGASFAVFLASGLLHDFIISLAARGGYGLPTLYFMIQFGGVLLERSPVGRKLKLRRGWRGRAYAAAFVLLPAPLLFHMPFIENVVLPMLRAWGAIV